MKTSIKITLTSLLMTLLFSECIYSQSVQGYEYELTVLVNTFKRGVPDNQEFELLSRKFDRLENEIDDLNDKVDTYASNQLLKKSEALTSLIGELSPNAGNYNLTLEKYELAAPILGLRPFQHPHHENGSYCLPIAHFSLWEESYQALLIVNNTPKLIRYNSTVIEAKEIITGNVNQSTIEGGVDCYSLRGIAGFFTTADGIIKCIGLDCQATPHCLTRKTNY